MQSDGGVFSACVNAGTLALIDAGVPVKDYATSSTAVMANNTETPLVDASYAEESQRTAVIEVALMPATDKVVMMEMASSVSL